MSGTASLTFRKQDIRKLKTKLKLDARKIAKKKKKKNKSKCYMFENVTTEMKMLTV